MVKVDILAIQDTIEVIKMVLTETETQLTQIINNAQDTEDDLFHFACHVRYAIAKANETFRSTLYK